METLSEFYDDVRELIIVNRNEGMNALELGHAAYAAKNYKEAEKQARRAWGIYDGKEGKHKTQTIKCMTLLALTLESMGVKDFPLVSWYEILHLRENYLDTDSSNVPDAKADWGHALSYGRLRAG